MDGTDWVYLKQPASWILPHSQVNETFLKLLKTSSQGGVITFFHDQKLETSTNLEMISIVSWKSTRLKRKTVNTQSAECQAMIAAVGQVHWFHFLLLEIMGKELSQAEWEGQLSAIPFVAVTDSRSLYDCQSKLVCTYTQTDDKRTAIDVAIAKDDLRRTSGHTRWVEGENMLCDPLTKRMKGDFLRAVASKGYWSLNKLRFEACCTLLLVIEALQSLAGVNLGHHRHFNCLKSLDLLSTLQGQAVGWSTGVAVRCVSPLVDLHQVFPKIQWHPWASPNFIVFHGAPPALHHFAHPKFCP